MQQTVESRTPETMKRGILVLSLTFCSDSGVMVNFTGVEVALSLWLG